MKVLITGASGMVGRYLANVLQQEGIRVRALLRTGSTAVGPWSETVTVAELPADPRVLEPAIDGCEAVIHLAGRAHVLRETEPDPLAAFRRVNLEGTRALLEAAAGRARRFVFVSTIGVHGGETVGDEAIHERSPLRPHTPYAVSKAEAEEAVAGASARHGLETVIVRPPLIYGAYVKGNFARLMKLVQRGLPLPFGSPHNRRSLVGAANLAELLALSVRHAAAAGQTFVAADAAPLSTAALIEHMGEALGRPARLLPFPPGLLRAGAAMVGLGATMNQLTGSLVVDAQHAQAVTGWRARHGVASGMRDAAQWLMHGTEPW